MRSRDVIDLPKDKVARILLGNFFGETGRRLLRPCTAVRTAGSTARA